MLAMRAEIAVKDCAESGTRKAALPAWATAVGGSGDAVAGERIFVLLMAIGLLVLMFLLYSMFFLKKRKDKDAVRLRGARPPLH